MFLESKLHECFALYPPENPCFITFMLELFTYYVCEVLSGLLTDPFEREQ